MTGPTGADGADGVDGVTGPTGPVGPTGAGGGLAAWSYAARTGGGSIAVATSGTPIALPDGHNLNGVTVDAGNTTFTVGATGTYYVSFQVHTNDGSDYVDARVTVNGTPSPVLSDEPDIWIDMHAGQAILDLAAGDELTLELFGVTRTIPFEAGTAANLAIFRIA